MKSEQKSKPKTNSQIKLSKVAADASAFADRTLRALRRFFKKAAIPALIIICASVFTGAVCAGVGYIGNKATIKLIDGISPVEKEDILIPEVDGGTGYITFTLDKEDREFRVLQLTDTHLGGGFLSIKKDSWAINAISALVHETKPDLIIVTGDMVYPVPFSSGTIDNLVSTRLFARLMERLGVYWTVVFGNH
ncbi:MAG: metallophosphoesterase, partial [Clostridiales bacterium]|nr:metallophosphoesterase [Clostridiales bacterium]